MPRLLPRLLKVLQETQSNPKHIARSQNVGPRKRKSLYRPSPVALPSFHPAGRTRSILLDENPITDKQAFAKHKRLPPRVHLGPRPVSCGEHDVPREMTTQEREWWSSPYLRMLATPVRQCTISKRYLPNDFLVRLAVLRLPSTTQNTRSVEVLMPDGLEHPKYKRRKGCVAAYVSCWKDIVQSMKSSVSLPGYGANIFVPKHLSSHINHLLRLRVLQELKVLTESLKRSRGRVGFDTDTGSTILRRLTRSEFKIVRETGTIPFSDAVAVLAVPPVNRDPTTKLRPQPSQEPVIPSNEHSTPVDLIHKRPLPPLSMLYPVSAPEWGVDSSLEIPFSTFLPNAYVPLYNGVTMFPSPPNRAALHKSLTELLDVERHFRGTRSKTMCGEESGRVKGDAKGSHAFLLVSNEQTVKRADTAALAVALWRLRMWEGDAFAGKDNGWEVGRDWRVEQANRL